MNLLAGKTAVITGCSRGIGNATLHCFAQHGASVFACVRVGTEGFSAQCARLSQHYGVFIRPICFDLSIADEIKRGMMEIGAEKRPIDILINNAGMAPAGRLFQRTPIEEMRRVLEVNFVSMMGVTQYISRMMVRRKSGSIVNLSSIAAIDGDPGQLEYAASKAAVIAATKKLAIELGESGVRVNAVAPGLTSTDMIKGMAEELFQRTIGRTILKRAANPAEIANVLLFLASDLSSFVTGQVIRVDGGM